MEKAERVLEAVAILERKIGRIETMTVVVNRDIETADRELKNNESLVRILTHARAFLTYGDDKDIAEAHVLAKKLTPSDFRGTRKDALVQAWAGLDKACTYVPEEGELRILRDEVNALHG